MFARSIEIFGNVADALAIIGADKGLIVADTAVEKTAGVESDRLESSFASVSKPSGAIRTPAILRDMSVRIARASSFLSPCDDRTIGQ